MKKTQKIDLIIAGHGSETAPSPEPVRSIWMLTREYGRLAGAGGVKDVAMQLARALAGDSGRSVSVVMPRYGFMDPPALGFSRLADPVAPSIPLSYEVDLNYIHSERHERVGVWKAMIDGVILYLLEADRFSEKTAVYTYSSVDEEALPQRQAGAGHDDYFAMNVLLQKGALALMQILSVHPDIIHCHDGHTALLPAMMREQSGLRHYFRTSAAVVTIHNAGIGYHQEVADLSFAHASTGLPWRVIMGNRLADSFDPLLAAASYAVVNTVSEQYARELQESDDDHLTGWLGHTLAERGVVLQGITNGIDPDEFSPLDARKTGIPFPFTPLTETGLAGKRLCKEALLQELGGGESVDGIVPVGFLHFRPELPLFSFIGRITEQKGIGVLLASLRLLLAARDDFQFLLLGSGGQDEEQELARLAHREEYLGRVCILKGFHPALANRVYAAGDFFLIPSRYEPCGLTDFIAQLFGNLPIVHRVGGLVKVEDEVTGFSYIQHNPVALQAAMERALRWYHLHPEKIRAMQRQAVQRIYEKYSWDKVMRQYLGLYRQARDNMGNGGNPFKNAKETRNDDKNWD